MPPLPAGVEALSKTDKEPKATTEQNLVEAYTFFMSLVMKNDDIQIFSSLLESVDWEKARVCGRAAVEHHNEDLWHFLQAPPCFSSMNKSDLKNYVEWSGVKSEWTELIEEVIAEAGDDLLKKTNVIDVRVDNEYVNGKETSEPAISILVRKKLPIRELSAEDRIPSVIRGYRTDVVQIQDPQSKIGEL